MSGRPGVRGRIVALALGFGLSVAALAAYAGWRYLYVHGTEQCTRCGAERVVDRRGPFWTHSEPTWTRSRDEGVASACAEHEWQRTGCWEVDGGFAYCGAQMHR